MSARREDQGREVRPEYVRVRALREAKGLSKAFIFSRLRSGELRAVKLGGCLLIEQASVDELFAAAKPWRPK